MIGVKIKKCSLIQNNASYKKEFSSLFYYRMLINKKQYVFQQNLGL